MQTLDTLMADVDQLVRSGSKSERDKTLAQVNELYFSTIDLHKDEHVDFFGDVFSLLVDYVDTQARADLGQRVAPLARAPAKLIRRLANDDEIAVAGEVISHSNQLRSDDLEMLARTKSQAHLLAISRRDRLDTAVTAVLVDRGDSDVARGVADNAGAEFSEDGFARLAQRTLDDVDLAVSVGTRADIPPNVLRAVVLQATDAVRSHILAAASSQMKAEIERVVEGASTWSRRDYTRARKLVEGLRHGGRLGEREVLAFATARKIEETVAALSVLCRTPADIIEGFMEHNAAAMPVVCRAADLSWNATRAVMVLCPAIGGVHNDDVMRRALANYNKLSRPTSEKLLRFWFVRGSGGDHRRQQDAIARPPVARGKQPTRRPVDLPAVIVADGKTVAEGIIEDLSTDGASIRFSSAFEVPPRFALCLADGTLRRQCEIRWQTRDAIGVRFLK